MPVPQPHVRAWRVHSPSFLSPSARRRRQLGPAHTSAPQSRQTAGSSGGVSQ